MNDRRQHSQRGWLLPVVLVLAVGFGGVTGLIVRDSTLGAAGGTPATDTTTPTTEPADDATGSTTVELAEDVANDPRGADIVDLIQRHFDAINDRDYEVWATTVSTPRAAGMPAEDWQEAYLSSRVTDIMLRRIEPTGSGLVVLLSLRSEQDPELAPEELPVGCIVWRVAYLVIDEEGESRLGGTRADAREIEEC